MKTGSLFVYTAIILAFVSNAYAYIDPGSGGTVLQFFIAAVVGCLIFFRKMIFRIKSFFVNLIKGGDSG